MKNLLIISYCFPPTQEIGGLRPYLLAKYIKNFGYNPIIVTKYDSEELDKNFNIIITDKFIDSYNLFQPKFTIKSNLLFTIIKDIISFPDYQYRWKNICLEAINKHVNLDNIDIIYSTSSPITCHLIAKTLKRKLNIPWVADLRDLWYGNHYNNNLLIRSKKHLSFLKILASPLFLKLSG